PKLRFLLTRRVPAALELSEPRPRNLLRHADLLYFAGELGETQLEILQLLGRPGGRFVQAGDVGFQRIALALETDPLVAMSRSVELGHFELSVLRPAALLGIVQRFFGIGERLPQLLPLSQSQVAETERLGPLAAKVAEGG